MMRRIADIIRYFKEYILLSFCILMSLALMVTGDTPQIRALRSTGIGIVAVLQDLAGFIPNYFGLQSENRILRERNLRLSDEVSRLREASLENTRLRRLLGFREMSPHSYAPARVVGKQLGQMRSTITLDAGSRDSVGVDMPVVTDAGLAGRIIAVSERYSVAMLLWHRDFRASAKLQRERVDGIIMWEAGPALILKNIAKTLDVRPGDVVVTSDYSTVFPAGIRIGIVSSVRQIPGDLFQEVLVEPAADQTRMEEVFILLRAPDPQRIAVDNIPPR